MIGSGRRTGSSRWAGRRRRTRGVGRRRRPRRRTGPTWTSSKFAVQVLFAVSPIWMRPSGSCRVRRPRVHDPDAVEVEVPTPPPRCSSRRARRGSIRGHRTLELIWVDAKSERTINRPWVSRATLLMAPFAAVRSRIRSIPWPAPSPHVDVRADARHVHRGAEVRYANALCPTGLP